MLLARSRRLAVERASPAARGRRRRRCGSRAARRRSSRWAETASSKSRARRRVDGEGRQRGQVAAGGRSLVGPVGGGGRLAPRAGREPAPAESLPEQRLDHVARPLGRAQLADDPRPPGPNSTSAIRPACAAAAALERRPAARARRAARRPGTAPAARSAPRGGPEGAATAAATAAQPLVAGAAAPRSSCPEHAQRALQALVGPCARIVERPHVGLDPLAGRGSRRRR